MNRRADVVWWTVAGLAVLAGISARFVALGAAALAEDEYYLLTSVQYILNHGIPTHPQGGYYVRGLIQQYLTAPILLLSGSSEWSVRIIPVLASLAGIPAVALIGRRVGGTAVAALAVALFGLSVWQIEFARFGRMYAPFQTLFLWQCYLLLLVTLDGKLRLWPRMLLLSVVGILVYEGAILLWAIAAIPLLSGHVRTTLRSLFASGSALVTLVVWQMFDFRRMGQPPKLPAEIVRELEAAGSSSSLPVHLPAPGFAALLERPVLAIMLAAAIAGATWLVARQPAAGRDRVALAFALLLLGLAGLGLFGLALVMVLLAWLIRPAVLIPVADRRTAMAIAGTCTAAVLAWATVLSLEGVGAYGVAKQLLNYPPISQAFVQQWLDTMPRMTMLFVALMAARVVIELATRTRSEPWRMLAATALVAVVMTAVIRTGQLSSRYSFFMYATVLLLTAESLWMLAGMVSRDVRVRTAVGVLGLAAVFIISDDFSFRHLARINSPQVMYRVNMPVQLWQHLVPRDDFRTPALFVNERIQDGDIVIAGPPAVPHYLDRHDYSYELYPGIRFFDVVTAEGTRELWTDAQLLWREESLFETLCSTTHSAWLVLHADPRDIRSARDARVRSRLQPWSVFTNFGETVAVFRVPGDEWRAAGGCVAADES